MRNASPIAGMTPRPRHRRRRDEDRRRRRRRRAPVGSSSGRQVPTRPERGGAAVLADCAALARDARAGTLARRHRALRARRPRRPAASADTVDWRGLDVAAAIAAPRRSCSRRTCGRRRWPRRRFGAGRGRSPFLFVDLRDGGERVPRRRRRAVRGSARAGDHARRAAGRADRERTGARRGGRSRARRGRARGPGVTQALVDEAAAALAQRARRARERARSRAARARRRARRRCTFSGHRVEAAFRPLLAYPSSPPLELVGSCRGRRAASSARRCALLMQPGARLGARARRDRPLARPDRAARLARGDARGPRRVRRGRSGARRPRGQAHCLRVATERRTTSAWRSGSPRSRGARGPRSSRSRAASSRAARFRWRDGDVLLAVSSSGEFRDLVEAIDGRVRRSRPSRSPRRRGRRSPRASVLGRSSPCSTSGPSPTRRRSAATSPPRSACGPR